MIRWFSDQDEMLSLLSMNTAMDKAVGEHLSAKAGFPGWCEACSALVDFVVAHVDGKKWTDMRESILCLHCGLNGRMRMIVHALREQPPEGQFLMMEAVTPLFHKLAERYPFVQGAEFFGPDVQPGEMRRFGETDVRHESLLALSLRENELDYLFHGDVLEHVPDHRLALTECFRVLRPGGTLLFTCPVFSREKNRIRSRVIDGNLVHDLPEAFHGNPVDSAGCLVFTDFGQELMDDIRDAGFSRVEVGLLYDPFQGIVSNNNPYPDGHMWPVIYRAKK